MCENKRLFDANALNWGRCPADGKLAKAWLDEAPTVDAVEVAHARWECVNESENVWMCTGDKGCGGEMIILEKTPLENGFVFCPYCGAKMDGGNEDV